MKIIGFTGSPRAMGNTAWTVNQILEGARRSGADTVHFHTKDLDIKPCQGCLACSESGRCAISDDMQKVYAELTEADALVLGSPIYMGQMSAQTVTFVDRLFSQITPRFSPQFKEYNAGKMLVLAITQGNPDEKLFKTYIDYVAGMFGLLEFVVKEVVVIAGTRTTSAVEVPNLAETLMEAGATLVHEKSIHQ